MNLSKEISGEFIYSIKLTVEPQDYQEKVDGELKKIRKSAAIKGFRPGQVPASVIKKMYGREVMKQEIGQVIGHDTIGKINELLESEKKLMIGTPIIDPKLQKNINWDTDTDFEFNYKVGFTNDFEFNWDKITKVPYYKVVFESDDIDKEVDNFCSKYGEYKKSDTVDGECYLTCSVQQADANGNVLENGVKIETTSFSIKHLKNENDQKLIKGKKVGDTFVLVPHDAFNHNYCAMVLKITEAELHDKAMTPYIFTITDVEILEKAVPNQEFWDKLFGKDAVKTDEEFRAKVSDVLKYQNEMSVYRLFKEDARKFLLDTFDIQFSTEFIKDWVFNSNEGKFTREQIDLEQVELLKSMKWMVLKNKIITLFDIKVSEEELISYSETIVEMQLQQYGITNLPDDEKRKYAKNMLENEKEAEKLYEQKFEGKLFDLFKENMTVESEIKMKDFELLVKKAEEHDHDHDHSHSH